MKSSSRDKFKKELDLILVKCQMVDGLISDIKESISELNSLLLEKETATSIDERIEYTDDIVRIANQSQQENSTEDENKYREIKDRRLRDFLILAEKYRNKADVMQELRITPATVYNRADALVKDGHPEIYDLLNIKKKNKSKHPDKEQ